jgi:hypothetical protein
MRRDASERVSSSPEIVLISTMPTGFLPLLHFSSQECPPNLKGYICDAIADRQDINTVALQDQWKELIVKPLEKLRDNSPSPSPFTFVIDALDECNSKDVGEIIRLLIRELDAVKIRAFVTSRPETLIHSSFVKGVELFVAIKDLASFKHCKYIQTYTELNDPL